MKSLNPAELAAACDLLNEKLKGAQLQDVFLGPKGPILSFWNKGNHFIYFELSPLSPLVLFFEDRIPVRKDKNTRPVTLFLRSHGINKLFDKAWVDPSQGRVMYIHLLGTESICELEVRLFPHGQNLTVHSGGKSVSWQKPKELPPLAEGELAFEAHRSLYDIKEEWLAKNKKSSTNENQKSPQVDDLLKKKKRAIKKVELELEKRKGQLWFEVGQELIEKQNLESIDPKYAEYIDPTQSFSWNTEKCFDKAKENKKKIGHLEARLHEMTEEYKAIEVGAQQVKPDSSRHVPSIGSLFMQKSGVRGRKLSLDTGAEAVLGKSAKDNLMLLRRAQAWDLWLHLRDYPGAHVIIRRNRGRQITDAEIKRVSQWLVSETIANKQLVAGEYYQVILAECRHVRPIKGDKIGRVTFQNEKTYRFQV